MQATAALARRVHEAGAMKLTLAIASFALVSIPTLASAQGALDDRTEPRFRFGIGGTGSFGHAASKDLGVSASNVGPGLVLDLGVQLGDRAAVYLHSEASSLVITNQFASYAIGEWTPVNWFSIGSGLGLDSLVELLGCYPPGCSRTSWAGVSVPLLLGFNIGHRPSTLERRSVLRIGLEGAVGIEPSSAILGWHTTASLGFTMM